MVVPVRNEICCTTRCSTYDRSQVLISLARRGKCAPLCAETETIFGDEQAPAPALDDQEAVFSPCIHVMEKTCHNVHEESPIEIKQIRCSGGKNTLQIQSFGWTKHSNKMIVNRLIFTILCVAYRRRTFFPLMK